jgi:peptidoglycan-associated lipoprotein
MTHRRTVYVVLLVSLVALTSCKKRAPVPPPLALAGPPPAPPAVPAAPIISLSASRTTIDEGESASLAWKAENSTSVQISELGIVEPNGTAQVSPLTATTYTATATGPGGAASDTVRITVNPRPSVPPPPPEATTALSLDDEFKSKIQDVYFDYDMDKIRRDQELKLETLAAWLKTHPEARIVIEGHCDERGSQEYNVALGDSRAYAARIYLSSVGISADRMQAITYGEERPICREENESCWSRNRRAHFVLLLP